MCGICGVVYRDPNRSVDAEMLWRMCRTMKHRGPDDEGSVLLGPAGLAMRRLSIIDLSTGHQPMTNEDGKLAIVFNGEIYNHKEIRPVLEGKGHRYQTVSDTESILHGYEAWGPKVCDRLNGMFGFAIWDSSDRTLFLARDRLGIKPLYYYTDNEKLVFGSEIKALLACSGVNRDLDMQALDNYMTFEYIPAPKSIFRHIRKLEPGCWLTWREGNLRIERYWSLKPQEIPIREEEAAERLHALLADSVQKRLLSDVPLGAFLSGGIDSSIMVSLMAGSMSMPVKTFSIGFKESSYNELPYARAVAEKYGTEHHEFILEADALALTEKLIRHLDEPFGDFSIFPTYLVSQMARNVVTVALSGDGGDELFGGYDTYRAQRFDRSFYHRLPKLIKRGVLEKYAMALPPTAKKKGWINSTRRFVQGTMLPKSLGHVRWMVFLMPWEREHLFTPRVLEASGDPYDFIHAAADEAGSVSDVTRMGYVDVKTYLTDDILVKVDRMSMAASLEARVPYLDYRVVEFAFSLPPEYKMRGFRTKVFLKKAFWSDLPAEVQRRDKQGFSIPIKNWIRGELRPMMTDLLSESRLRRQGLFEPDFVHGLMDQHLRGEDNHSHKLWALMVFQQWYDLFAAGNPTKQGR